MDGGETPRVGSGVGGVELPGDPDEEAVMVVRGSGEDIVSDGGEPKTFFDGAVSYDGTVDEVSKNGGRVVGVENDAAVGE